MGALVPLGSSNLARFIAFPLGVPAVAPQKTEAAAATAVETIATAMGTSFELLSVPQFIICPAWAFTLTRFSSLIFRMQLVLLLFIYLCIVLVYIWELFHLFLCFDCPHLGDFLVSAYNGNDLSGGSFLWLQSAIRLECAATLCGARRGGRHSLSGIQMTIIITII